MKQKNLWLLCGIPGSGKSTWVQRQIVLNGGKQISRDEIRFAMVREDEDYFAHEDEVFEKFIHDINEALLFYNDVYVDATHINERSRNKVLNRIKNITEININPVNFIVPIETCIERNEMRVGRAVVPRSVIRRMYTQFMPANDCEQYDYNEIVTIKS